MLTRTRRVLAVALAPLMMLAMVVTGGAAGAEDPYWGPPIAVDGGWTIFHRFTANAVGAYNDYGGWWYLYTSSAPTKVVVTDYLAAGDRWNVYDGYTLLGETSAPGCSGCIGHSQSTPDGGLADPYFSHGSFCLAAGSHAIRMQTTAGIDAGGGLLEAYDAAIKVVSDVSGCVFPAYGTATSLAVSPASPVTYQTQQTFTATVDTVPAGAAVPTGTVQFQADLGTAGSFVNQGAPVALSGGTASIDLTLPVGTHAVKAVYAGDTSGDPDFNGSESSPLPVTVDKAPTSVAAITAPYVVVQGKSLALTAQLSSPTAADCLADRTVRFVITLDGAEQANVTGSYDSAGRYKVSIPTSTSWPAGVYQVTVSADESASCLAAAAVTADDLVTVATPGDAATGGGWYQLPQGEGAQKKVNFGFTVRYDRKSGSYKGELLLINKQAWRLKGDLTTYGKVGATGTAGGTGALYRAECTTLEGITTCEWVHEADVSFQISFTDVASGGGKKATVVDRFALTGISASDADLISALQPLKGGNITIR